MLFDTGDECQGERLAIRNTSGQLAAGSRHKIAGSGQLAAGRGLGEKRRSGETGNRRASIDRRQRAAGRAESQSREP